MKKDRGESVWFGVAIILILASILAFTSGCFSPTHPDYCSKKEMLWTNARTGKVTKDTITICIYPTMMPRKY